MRGDTFTGLDAETEDTWSFEPSLAELVADLAKLSLLEYEQTREGFAKEHKIRVSALDKEVEKLRTESGAPDDDETGLFEHVTPWDEPVDGADLLDTVDYQIKRFCVLPEHAAPLMAAWVVHAWAHDASDISPVLAFTSPEKRCGKSTAMAVVHALTPRAEIAANLSAAVMFRLIERHKPTVLIDEADTFLEAREEMRGMINGGHNRQLAFVWRCEGDDYEPKRFNVWAPKAVAMIGDLPDTLEDRALVVQLKRKESGETVERMRASRVSELLPVRRMLARWVADNEISLANADPVVPEELNDRAQDNARCLCAIADVAGGDWPETIRKALVGMAAARAGDEPKSKGVMLLTDIGEILERWKGDRIKSADLVAELVAIEDGPWEVWKGGENITTRMVAALLKPYGVRPQRDRGSRFYEISELRNAVSRYVK
jgi:putative DNA primase/helicase